VYIRRFELLPRLQKQLAQVAAPFRQSFPNTAQPVLKVRFRGLKLKVRHDFQFSFQPTKQ
jgi:hypothetical protein